jgi:hypothetical protein
VDPFVWDVDPGLSMLPVIEMVAVDEVILVQVDY